VSTHVTWVAGTLLPLSQCSRSVPGSKMQERWEIRDEGRARPVLAAFVVDHGPSGAPTAARYRRPSMSEQALRERIEELRQALERIRDRAPEEEAIEGAPLGTVISSYAAGTRMIAESALATDDVRADAESSD